MNDLLLKAIIGTLTTEESEQLRLWREADEANERLYQRTMDSAYLEGEYRRRQGVDTARPLAAMQARLALHRQRRQLTWWRAAAAVAAVVAIGSLSYAYLKGAHVREASSQIVAGSMRATLQMMDGDTPVLALPVGEGATADQPISADGLLADLRTARSATQSSRKEPDAPMPTLSLITPRGGEFRITLEDGTEVWLNAQSQLVYPEHFAQSERRVRVSGEAYFHVARNEQQPFIVEADGQAVRVLGTEFNVRSYAEDADVQTTLVSGSIALQPIGAGDAQLLLTPGHQAVFSKTEHDIQVHSVDTEVATSWKDGKFVFENQTLEQIMLTLARWYDFTYDFADRRAAQTVFMGRIPRYADFADVIAILESSGGLHLKVDRQHVSIASK